MAGNASKREHARGPVRIPSSKIAAASIQTMTDPGRIADREAHPLDRFRSGEPDIANQHGD